MKLNDLPRNVSWYEEAINDVLSLDNAQRLIVLKQITKVAQNPQPKSEGGYGEPLGHHRTADLTNCLRIKLKKSGLRIVYKYIRSENGMEIIVVGVRTDEAVYRMAADRIKNTNRDKKK